MMMLVAIAACGICLVIALVRTAGTAFDRVLAVNAIGTLIIIGIALHGFIMERPEFVISPCCMQF